MLPASLPRDPRAVASSAADYAGQTVVAADRQGAKLRQGVAAWLRQAGARAEYLEGGFDAWGEANGLLIRPHPTVTLRKKPVEESIRF